VGPGESTEIQDERPKKEPPAYLVSAGLAGMPIANDLLSVDFTETDEEEHQAPSRALPFNVEYNPDIGTAEPLSECNTYPQTYASPSCSLSTLTQIAIAFAILFLCRSNVDR
jgi:hypothetical protein